MLRKDAQSNLAHRGAQQREQPSFCEDSDSDEEACPLPQTHQDVLHSPEREEWLNGTEEEKRANLERKGLELAKCKKDAFGASTSIGRRSNGMGKRTYKVRFVALGYGQEKDEAQQTFAPVVKGITISILFALPSSPICSLIGRTSLPHSAPLISDLSGSEEVYLGKLPDEEMPDGYCFRLRKARYGLRSSPRNWRSTSR